MTDYELGIAEREGKQAFFDGVPSEDNPYDGVNVWMKVCWWEGWWSGKWGFE